MTYFLFLALALAVAGVGWGIRGRSALWGQGLVVVGCVGCLAAIGWQVRQTVFPAEAKPPNRAHAVVGFFLATQTQREIAGQSGTVVMILPPKSALPAETAETYANSFRAPLLRGHPEWEVQVAALEATAREVKAGRIPLAAFKQVVAKFPRALAFVCIAGVPAGIETLFPPDQATVPPLFVFDAGGTTNWVPALVQHRIRSVIVPRPDVDAAAMGGIAGMPGEIFDRLYYLATAETAQQVAAKLAANPAPARR
jgi:hypothetical protein